MSEEEVLLFLFVVGFAAFITFCLFAIIMGYKNNSLPPAKSGYHWVEIFDDTWVEKRDR